MALAKWRSTVVLLTQTACITLLAQQYIGDITLTYGPSMMPTLNPVGDVIALEYVSWRWKRSLKVGDVVAAISPYDSTKVVCKRVTGMPGDLVIRDERISNEVLVVPKGHVWLQGDNTEHSVDSRLYGPVPMGLVKGKVVAKLWPEFVRIK